MRTVLMLGNWEDLPIQMMLSRKDWMNLKTEVIEIWKV